MNAASCPPVDISLVLFDVDGVLTDGTLVYGQDGEVLKSFNAKDGLAFSLLRAHGVLSGVISGRSSAPLQSRFRELRVDFVKTGVKRKGQVVAEIMSSLCITPANVAFVGDDIVDLDVLPFVKTFIAPADAHELVLRAATHTLTRRGGRGAAREAAEMVILSKGMSLVECYDPLLHAEESVGLVQ